MAGIVNYGGTGTLTINGVALNGPAWDIPDLSPLWGNRTQLGANAEIAGVAGRRAKRRRYGEMEFQLVGKVIGWADRTGAVIPSPEQGIISNIDYLVENVVDPVPDGGAETVPAAVTVAGQPDRRADVQAEFVFGALRGVKTRLYVEVPFVLRLTVPGGRFVPFITASAAWLGWTGAAAGTVTPP